MTVWVVRSILSREVVRVRAWRVRRWIVAAVLGLPLLSPVGSGIRILWLVGRLVTGGLLASARIVQARRLTRAGVEAALSRVALGLLIRRGLIAAWIDILPAPRRFHALRAPIVSAPRDHFVLGEVEPVDGLGTIVRRPRVGDCVRIVRVGLTARRLIRGLTVRSSRRRGLGKGYLSTRDRLSTRHLGNIAAVLRARQKRVLQRPSAPFPFHRTCGRDQIERRNQDMLTE